MFQPNLKCRKPVPRTTSQDVARHIREARDKALERGEDVTVYDMMLERHDA
jgi:hypothetical protein